MFFVSEKMHFSVKFCFVLVDVLFVIANGRGEIGWDKYHSRCKLGAILLLTRKLRTIKMSVVCVCLSVLQRTKAVSQLCKMRNGLGRRDLKWKVAFYD